MSSVKFFFSFYDIVVELAGGGSVIDGAYPVLFKTTQDLFDPIKIQLDPFVSFIYLEIYFTMLEQSCRNMGPRVPVNSTSRPEIN